MDKAPDAFRTISEVADELDVPQHVLRFWESRFQQIRPMKRAGGRRYYRPDDVDLLRGIRHLLYGEGYTIRGVQRILREQGQKFVQAVWETAEVPTSDDAAETAAAIEAHETHEAEPLAAKQLPPDEAARALFGLLKAPAAEASEPEIRSAPSAPPPPPRLTSDDVRRLQGALQELRECRALIDRALSEEAA